MKLSVTGATISVELATVLQGVDGLKLNVGKRRPLLLPARIAWAWATSLAST
ncbi:MAG TPA: hypothetical protein PLW86_13170 [Rhodocyclaceae bacterium]|nr:hypothetical protein [Rhodocyclaceae bacterium]